MRRSRSWWAGVTASRRVGGASPTVITLALTNEIPEDPDTQLLDLLLGGEVAALPARQAPVAYCNRFGHRREVCSTRSTSTTPAVTRYATM